MKPISPSQPVRKKMCWVILTGGFLLAAGLIITWTMSPVKDAPQGTLSEFPTTHRTRFESKPLTPKANSPEHATNALPQAASPRLKPAGSRTVSPAIAEVFPDLNELPADWREFRPDTITVAPHADLPITFTRIALKEEDRYVTWIGRNPHMPGASLVGVATANGYDAILVIPASSQFSFHIRGQTIVTAEASPGEEACEVDPVQSAREPIDSGASVVEIVYASNFDPDIAIRAATTTPTVDVLFAYNADALSDAAAKLSDPVGYLDAQCKASIEMANVALSQSGVTTFNWRHLGVVETPAYTPGKDVSENLKTLFPDGVLGDWVKSIRQQWGADQIMLLVGNKGVINGVALVAKERGTPSNLALSTTVWNGSYRIIAHELAHNFGCLHDRAHSIFRDQEGNEIPEPENNGLWCYGYLWQNPPLPPGYTGNIGTGGTIMSYANGIIPYFSNPNITVRLTGSLFGWSVNPDLGSQQIGQPETHPNAAYNARVLSENSLAMSNLSEEISPPTITIQPRSTNVSPGQSFTLSVTATGGALAYQWSKNGVAISGAENANYSKISDASEPDSYQVTISNRLGSVTSNAVRVNVTTQPPAGSSNSSGGGGGGSQTGWFIGLLYLLIAVREAGSKKSDAPA